MTYEQALRDAFDLLVDAHRNMSPLDYLAFEHGLIEEVSKAYGVDFIQVGADLGDFDWMIWEDED